jgi:NAD-dependent dihydropyrimidine dehydrogenase PreA subunit
MAYVITTACMTEKATDCVSVCPVDCIKEGEISISSILIIV